MFYGQPSRNYTCFKFNRCFQLKTWSVPILVCQIDVYKKPKNCQQSILETSDMYPPLSIGQNLPTGLLRLTPSPSPHTVSVLIFLKLIVIIRFS